MTRMLWLLLLIAPKPAFAAGFFRPGVGVGSLGAGGTGVSGGLAGYGHWYNPALLGLSKGIELTLDWTALDESLGFKRSRVGLMPPERVDDDANKGGGLTAATAFNCCGQEPADGMSDQAAPRHIPFLGVLFPLREDLVAGLALFGPQAPRREFPRTGSQRYGIVSNSITLAISQASLAYRRPNWGVGVGLANFSLLVDQVFTLSGDLQGTEDPSMDIFAVVAVSDPMIPVLSVGLWAAPMAGLRLGVSYLSPIGEECAGTGTNRVCGHVVAQGSIQPELNPGIAQLATVKSNDGGALVMRFPGMLRAGVSQKVGKRTEVSVEGFWERWGSIGDLTFVPKNVVFEAIGTEVVLANIIFPRNWDDTYGARFGLRYDAPKTWLKMPLQLRGGGQWESAATPANALDPGALDWEKAALTLGFGLEVLPGLTIDAFYLRSQTARFTVSNSQMRTTNILHEGEVADGKPGLETVSGNGDYTIQHQRFGLGLRYRLGT